MKRNYVLTAILVMVSVMIHAQRLDITLDDNSVVSFNVDKVKSLDFMPESEPGQVSGCWHLGWRLANTSGTTTRYDGRERWIFCGTVLKQIKSTGAETLYDLQYTEDMRKFKAISQSTGTGGSTYTILANDEEYLLLKVGSITYYFYRSLAEAHNADGLPPYPLEKS